MLVNAMRTALAVLLLLVVAGCVALYFLSVSPPPTPPPPPAPPPPPGAPFWGCGLVGDIQPDIPAWNSLIGALKKANPLDKVSTWNWAMQPTVELTGDFLFFPNNQCAGISVGQDQGFPKPGDTSQGMTVSDMALGANEPDQKGYCQLYHDPRYPNDPKKCKSGTLTDCDSEQMRKDGCQQDPCCCLSQGQAGCIYDVTGCGMWPVRSSGGSCPTDKTAPFPYECFGSASDTSCPSECRDAVVDNFKSFYETMGNNGYKYATAPLIASDLKFTEELMSVAGCDAEDVKQATGNDRLKKGCPTHTAFHFYSSGCPSDPDKAIAGFKDKVQSAKSINTQFNLAGTIVNELGSLTNSEGETCDPTYISSMMKNLFDYLDTDEAKGVVSQMTWFNQNKTGGTFDLRLVDETGVITPLGDQYMTSCSQWGQSAQAL